MGYCCRKEFMSVCLTKLFVAVTLLYFGLTFCSRPGSTEIEVKKEKVVKKRSCPSPGKTQAEYDAWYKCTHKDSLKIPKANQEDKLKFQFFAYGSFHFLARWELGRELPFKDNKPLCHKIRGDRGSWTCLGIAYHANKKWFDNLLGHKKPTLKRLNKLFKEQWGRRKLADWYFRNYVGHFYNECSFKAAFMLGDLAVTSGPKNAIRILQRSHGLVRDGLWGPQSRKACQKEWFLPKSFILAEKARYNRLADRPDQDRFRNGWLNRSNAKMEYTNRVYKKDSLKANAWEN